jgi:hypothetical protein
MAQDVDAQDITINYEGGSITMAIGNAKSLFGADYEDIVGNPETVTTAVKSHQRVRVIGEASSTVSAHNRTYQQWPTSQANNAAAGKQIMIQWDGSEGSWVARVTGAMADLGTYLRTAAPKVVTFRTSRGTKYGPFVKEITDPLLP